MGSGKTTVAQWLVRMTCAMALIFVGFAHQAPAFADGAFVPAEFAEYVLPDGTLPVICIAGKTDGKHTHGKAHAYGCEACRISASILLRRPSDNGSERLRIEAAAALPYKARAYGSRVFPPSKGPRAPPRDPASD
ncbi:hypothetical protein [Rhizobium sp. Root1220]|uniref:hypothetical protein n=1 Tax=Rhizobium sp. Root1220 TaxID=1736432 RepID=UPI0006FDC6AF|nr:hypothetical protein [Rhizobium sp. Root1220]KQV70283.1 hypothetical protein ASC90_09185 [Rhizobium sp. Root1220]